MANGELKTIKQIVDSTNSVSGYGASSLGHKIMGSIYSFNKVVRPSAGVNIEVSMMIAGVTDMIWSGKSKQLVAAHRVSIVIKGVKQETVSAEELVTRIRRSSGAFAKEEDYSSEEIIGLVHSQTVKFFPDKTVLPTTKGMYTIIEDKISPESKMQVDCSCSSYYWVFQWYNVENNVQIGGKRKQPAGYTYSRNSKIAYRRGKKATAGMNPIRNPRRAYGMCKHLTLLLGMLMDEGIVDEVNSGQKSPAACYRLNVSRFEKMDHISPEEYDNLTNKFKKDYKAKLLQRRRAIYGVNSRKPKLNFAQKNNPNIWRKS